MLLLSGALRFVAEVTLNERQPKFPQCPLTVSAVAVHGTVKIKVNFAVFIQNGRLYWSTVEKDWDLTCGLEERLEAGKQ